MVSISNDVTVEPKLTQSSMCNLLVHLFISSVSLYVYNSGPEIFIYTLGGRISTVHFRIYPTPVGSSLISISSIRMYTHKTSYTRVPGKIFKLGRYITLIILQGFTFIKVILKVFSNVESYETIYRWIFVPSWVPLTMVPLQL